jgi:putative folate metabolism gamma-glutamate ligase
MHIQALKTHRISLLESLEALLDQYIPVLREGAVVCLTSKIVSLSQGRVVPTHAMSKQALVVQEADLILQGSESPYGIDLTLKDNILIPDAGIDASNGAGHYILYPKDVQHVAALLWMHLRQRHGITRLGVLITDSKTSPLRRGVTGLALGWCGFEPLYSYVGWPDLDGRPLQSTQINVLDALATGGVLVMGEGDEQTPLALIQDAPKVTFVDRPPTAQEALEVVVAMEEDLYAPLFMRGEWRKA